MAATTSAAALGNANDAALAASSGMMEPTGLLADAGGLGGSSMAGGGLGQDFVLFDETNTVPSKQTLFSGSQQNTVALTPSLSITTNGGTGNVPSSSADAAFTQYRNGPLQHQNNVYGSLNESPFSSPASRPEDDFSPVAPGMSTTNSLGGFGSGVPIAGALPNQAPPSGTLSQGTPKPKRARGHGYSSSWNGGSIQQHLHQLQQTSPSSGQIDGGPSSTGMAPNVSFGGFGSVRSGSNSDWSGSDTSPRNPPSGSLGPPIQSLSLGDGSPEFGLSGEQLASLFPSNGAVSQQDHSAIAALAASAAGQINAQLTAQQQEDRARQQIRADLMGIDSRALKGQLRDIQQGGGVLTTSFAGMDGGGQPGNVLFPFVPPNSSASSATPDGTRQGPVVSSGATTGSSAAGQGTQGFMNSTLHSSSTSGSTPGQSISSTPHLAAQPQQPTVSLARPPAHPMRQFSARTQQAVDRAKAQKPTRKRMVRENSELTVNPQEAFLDYDNIDAMLQSSSSFHSSGSQASSSGPNLFASTPATTNASMGMAGLARLGLAHENDAVAAASGSRTPRALTDMPLSSSSSALQMESTPSLIDSSSSTGSNSRGNSSVPSPPQRYPLHRGETVRPLKQHQKPSAGAAVANETPSQQSSQSSMFSSSDLALLSPTESTTSSTDDEDEKPYAGTSSSNKATSNSSRGQPSSFGQAASRTIPAGQQGWGPRFSVVSSSSSESEDDVYQQHRGASTRSTGLPPGQQQSFQGASGPAQAPSQQQAGLGNADHVGPANIANLLGQYGQNFVQTPHHLPQQPLQPQQVQQQQHRPMPQEPLHRQGAFLPPLDTFAAQNMALPGQQVSSNDAPSESGSQSQDESARQSPSIRSSAQAIYPYVTHSIPPMPAQAMASMAYPLGALSIPMQQAHMAGGNGGGGMMNFGPPPHQQQQHYQHQARSHAPHPPPSSQPPRNRSRTRANADVPRQGKGTKKERESEESDDSQAESEEWDASSDDDDDDDDDDDGSEESSYREAAKTSKAKQRRARKSGASGGGGARRGSQGGTTGASGHLTVCDYVSPLTGDVCGTEFHRPYDLARHRETIHAREEATLLKQGKLTREQCVVLYKEVDPAKSMATVEWRCDGANGCGALFSRKDALLRHRRIRNH